MAETATDLITNAYEKAVIRLRSNGGSIYKAFNELGTGLPARALAAWFESVDEQFGPMRGRVFGAALTVAMMSVEADRRARRSRESAPPAGRWVRDANWEQRMHEIAAVTGQDATGLQCWVRPPLQAIVSRDELDDGMRWHVSVAHEDRVPTWEEFSSAVHELRPGVAMCVGLPPRSQWLNYDERTLHAWEIHDDALVASWRQVGEVRQDTPT